MIVPPSTFGRQLGCQYPRVEEVSIRSSRDFTDALALDPLRFVAVIDLFVIPLDDLVLLAPPRATFAHRATFESGAALQKPGLVPRPRVVGSRRVSRSS